VAPHTEATTAYWQRLLAASELPAAAAQPPWRNGYPARLPDGRFLMLPIRALPEREGEPRQAVASLLVNQAALSVVDELGALLAQALQPLAPDLLVGLPTLGLTLAAATARSLGHARYVPLGTSRKFWYDDALAADVVSITSPGQAKRIYLDPHQRPLLQGQRVVLVDDAISSGSTAPPVWDLLERVGAHVVGYGVAMRQGDRWRSALGAERAARVVGVFDSPLLQAGPQGWLLRG
jgi:adenine/guanine phosphoribosyltransferase-like PRPP-binding protein